MLTSHSTYIYFGEDTRATLVDLPVWVGSIPTEHLDSFEPRFRASLQKIADEGVDMARMGMVIARDERQLRSKLESAKGDTFSGTVIDDVLYGATDGSLLPESMDEITQYETLRNWTAQQWSDLLRRWVVFCL
jgi:Zn-dependent M16 (insulinase) family peptidase